MAKRKPVVIRDGKTREGYFPGRADVGPFKFTYRPALPERVLEYLKADTTTAALQMKAYRTLLGKHVIDWNVTEEDPANPDREIDVKWDEDVIKCVPHAALEYMVDAVCSYTAKEQAEEAKN